MDINKGGEVMWWGNSWGKRKNLIAKNVKTKYLRPFPLFFLSGVLPSRRLCGGVADWRACSPICQE